MGNTILAEYKLRSTFLSFSNMIFFPAIYREKNALTLRNDPHCWNFRCYCSYCWVIFGTSILVPKFKLLLFFKLLLGTFCSAKLSQTQDNWNISTPFEQKQGKIWISSGSDFSNFYVHLCSAILLRSEIYSFSHQCTNIRPLDILKWLRLDFVVVVNSKVISVQEQELWG